MRPKHQMVAPVSGSVDFVGGVVGPDATAQVEDLIQTMKAAGMGAGEALGHAAAILGGPAVRSAWEATYAGLCDRRGGGMALLSILDEVAAAAPMVADTWLSEVLAALAHRSNPWKDADDAGYVTGLTLSLAGRPWVTTIPPRLKVHTSLNLNGCTGITSLPEGISIGLRHDVGELDLGGCTNLKTLPGRLRVATNLFLTRCASWDGCFPPDIQVGISVFTDCHPDGIDLDDWREEHPWGERVKEG